MERKNIAEWDGDHRNSKGIWKEKKSSIQGPGGTKKVKRWKRRRCKGRGKTPALDRTKAIYTFNQRLTHGSWGPIGWWVGHRHDRFPQ